MADKIRWGILGCGSIAAKFAQALGCVEEAQLVAVGSRTDANANAFGDTYHVPRRYGSYQQLADDKDLDIIYVATPHHLHAENTILCLNAGRGVLCEKPLAVNARQGQAMMDCARDKRCFLMEAMWTRFLPLMAKVRELVADNAIGEVRMLAADFGFRCGDATEKQRLIDPHLAGGALLDVGIYPLALSSMLLGKPLHIHCAAAFGKTGVDEQNAIILAFDHGRLAVMYSALQTETSHEATIMGTEGMLRLHRSWWCGNKLTLIRPDKSEQFMELPSHDNGFIYEIQAAHQDLREGRVENALMPLDESLAILQTMDAIRKQWGFQYPFESDTEHGFCKK
jgi:dihydrodiol dehydrogenase / D-xylose 1-dehydrogenase (NADP)